jgi:hypothetical protein
VQFDPRQRQAGHRSEKQWCDSSADTDKGPNNLQIFPVITSAKISGNKLTIGYSLTSIKGTTYRIEFFASAVPPHGASAQGTLFLGSHDVTIRSGNTVTGTLKFTAPPGALTVIAATATDPGNNTSEFSASRTTGRTRTRRKILD